GGKIVAVSRDGYIIYGDVNGFVETKMSDVSYFSGALATWKLDADKHLLLLGIQGGTSSTVHGYREILLKEDGTLDPAKLSLRNPGKEAPSSVDDYEQYVVTIGKHPLSSIIQAPDGILFAATTQHGLWSYRYRDNKGKHIWNAED
ncbi:MAG: hypothetical protein LBC46_01885, partial [Treponema sp.]|nr:hypothetical protein [Treponema sp.]